MGRAGRGWLVCITHSTSEVSALTRKRLLQLDAQGQKQKLRELYADNLARLDRALDFCRARGLSLYRMTSGLFPFADDEAGADVLEEFREQVAAVGRRATELGIRLVLHPDQFVVLSSDSPATVANSIKILETHARVLDMLEQPRSPWALIEIHGGKSGRAERLVEQIGRLPEAVRARIAFENDEYAYGAAEILDVCRRAVGRCLRRAHHVVHEGGNLRPPERREMVEAARATWPVPEWQLAHISNGRASCRRPTPQRPRRDMPAAYRRGALDRSLGQAQRTRRRELRDEWLGGTRKSRDR